MTEAFDPTDRMDSPTPQPPSVEPSSPALRERAMLVRWGLVGVLILVGVLLYLMLGTGMPSLVEWRTA